MSELTIDPDIGADLECEVGDEISIKVRGTVTSKTPDGAKVMDIAEVVDYEHAGEEGEGEYVEEVEKPKRKGPSAVMVMIGKEK